MRRPIARIRINAGNPGWYDSLTNIHLTISRPEAIVYEGSNTTNIKRGVAHKLISVVDGDLDITSVTAEEQAEVEPKSVREVAFQPIVQEEVIEEVTPVEEAEVKVEETITEPVEEIVEEITTEEAVETVEETTEEVVEEKPKKKSTRKKTTKKEN